MRRRAATGANGGECGLGAKLIRPFEVVVARACGVRAHVAENLARGAHITPIGDTAVLAFSKAAHRDGMSAADLGADAANKESRQCGEDDEASEPSPYNRNDGATDGAGSVGLGVVTWAGYKVAATWGWRAYHIGMR